MLETIAFYFFALVVIGCFVVTVMAKQVIYAFSALAAGMIFISAFFFMLGAEFMGVVQIVVYTGAVMALYAFGMMFFDSAKDAKEAIKGEPIVFILSAIAAVVIVAMIAAPSLSIVASGTILENSDNTKELGVLLFTDYLLPFELTGLLLLTAMIAGIVLTGKKMEYTQQEERKQ
ncbi:NADH-quinone oxidoreductase subunit J [Campylobacterota bacterium]|nr:NADH-quinone oxidoreductase subunit J [Campylobacterota bacterium]